jgi:hypothetical protein
MEKVLDTSQDDVFCLAGFTYSQQIAEKAIAAKGKKTFNEMIPVHYRDFAKVFSEEESHRLPKHQPWDHAIDLEPDAVTHWKVKTYPMSIIEQEALDKFLEENLAKGYLRPSKSPMASPVFFIKKKDGSLQLIQDYRRLNKITIKNRYPLLLASDIINRLTGAQYFTKFDVRWGYHNIRIRKGDEWKAAIVTNRGLVKPTVMGFGFHNAPATFQALMNSILVDLIAQSEVAVYMDDILICMGFLVQVLLVVPWVFDVFHLYDFYFWPLSLGFWILSMLSLCMIVPRREVRMCPGRLASVSDWPTCPPLPAVFAFGFAPGGLLFLSVASVLWRPVAYCSVSMSSAVDNSAICYGYVLGCIGVFEVWELLPWRNSFCRLLLSSIVLFVGPYAGFTSSVS